MTIEKGKKDQAQPQSAMGEAFANAQQKAGHQYEPNANQPGQGQRGGRSRRSIMDMNSAFARPMPRRPTGEVVMAFQETMSQTLRRNLRQGMGDHFQLLVLDNNTQAIPLSVILVCFQDRVDNKDLLAVYSLVVEDSAPPLQNKYVNIPGYSQGQVEILTAPGDVMVSSNYMWEKITEFLGSVYGNRGMEILDAGSMVLPREMQPEDEFHVRRVLYNATQACFTVLETEEGGRENPFTIEWINQPGTTMVARLEYNPEQADTATGDPVRSDVRVVLQGTVTSQQNESGYEQVREISSVESYVDLVYSPPQQPTMPGQPMATQFYYPRVVITRADSQVDAATLELQLLALSTVTLLRRNMAWAGVYRNRPAKSPDLRDIGAIGYEINLTGDPNGKPEYVDTKEAGFDTNALYQFISATVHPDPLFSMDVEETGELSWIHQTFLAAANGDDLAYRRIMEAASNLTMKAFDTIWQGGPIAIDDNNRIHLGYYVEDGKRIDLRTIDYLALLNMAGKKDPASVVAWGNTFDQTDVPMEVRLEKRMSILESWLGSKIHVKGYARRITFNPAFLDALAAACAKAGLAIRPSNTQEFVGPATRGNFNAANFAFHGQNSQSLFSHGGPQWTGQNYGGFSNFTGRFGR